MGFVLLVEHIANLKWCCQHLFLLGMYLNFSVDTWFRMPVIPGGVKEGAPKKLWIILSVNSPGHCSLSSYIFRVYKVYCRRNAETEFNAATSSGKAALLELLGALALQRDPCSADQTGGFGLCIDMQRALAQQWGWGTAATGCRDWLPCLPCMTLLLPLTEPSQPVASQDCFAFFPLNV